MCLTTFNGEPLIAEKDIICYKVLIEERSCYLTPYMYKRVHKDQVVMETTEFVAPELLHYGKYCIGKGYIHAYIKKDDALNYQGIFPNEDIVIFKCIIPKGTTHYIGDSTICSRCMILSEIVYKTKE